LPFGENAGVHGLKTRSPTILKKALDEARLGPLHWRIWILSALGIFLDGFDLFVIGIAAPFIKEAFDVDAWMLGAITGSGVLGAIVGALVGGRITDRFGRKAIYLVDISLFIIFTLASAAAWSPWSLVVFRFLLGVGIGADYPICAAYVAETAPSRHRGRMLIAAFSFQAVGAVAAALVGIIVLEFDPSVGAWRWILGAGAIPALAILLLRVSVPESPRWSMERGRLEEASRVVESLIPAHELDRLDALVATGQARIARVQERRLGFGHLFDARYRRRTVLASVPWFLMDVATYGIGLFTPLILQAIAFKSTVTGATTPGGAHHDENVAGDFIHRNLLTMEATLVVSAFLLVGFALNLWLVDRVGRIRLQLLGFAGMAAGLLVLAGSESIGEGAPGRMALVLVGFIVFNLFMNLGPNSTTFVLPAELYPTRLRATGHGFAASCAKAGAALGSIALPVATTKIGTSWTLVAIAGACLLGLLVTRATRIDTTKRSLEDLEPTDVSIDH